MFLKDASGCYWRMDWRETQVEGVRSIRAFIQRSLGYVEGRKRHIVKAERYLLLGTLVRTTARATATQIAQK